MSAPENLSVTGNVSTPSIQAPPINNRARRKAVAAIREFGTAVLK
jgi:hypothetical protein